MAKQTKQDNAHLTTPTQLTGAEIVWATLVGEGVSTVFGYPGGAILPVYDALRKFPTIHHVLVRHEQGAAHMADGYTRASGRIARRGRRQKQVRRQLPVVHQREADGMVVPQVSPEIRDRKSVV